jgi:hypothetical protein
MDLFSKLLGSQNLSLPPWEFSRRLADQLHGEVTNDFLELLLRGMAAAFLFSEDYRENIQGFTGTYVFRTADGRVDRSAVFRDGQMEIENAAPPACDVCISFKDAKALQRFLLAENQDILDSILANDVEVEGNLNYIYRFGFLVRDLQQRLGAA